MLNKGDPDSISFNPKTIYTMLGILVILVGSILWIGSVRADVDQVQKEQTHQEQEIDLLKTQLSEMKIQLTIIQEQNKQLKATLEEVRVDVAVIKRNQ